MFVGETGVGRIIERACELMKQDKNEDVLAQGGIPLDQVQRALNFWFSVSEDLFGGEVSSNAANYFASGIKGRAYEMKKYEDHLALDGGYKLKLVKDGRLVEEEVALRNAMNEVLRDDYIEDTERVVARWNKIIEESGVDYRLTLPSRRFHRQVGAYAEHKFDPSGNLIDEATWQAKRDEWLPTRKDMDHLKTLASRVVEPGKFAHWIAPPRVGIKGRPVDFEYVRL